MKKLFLFAVSLVSYGLSAQAGQSIFIKNYSNHSVIFSLVKSNSANTIGNCRPYVKSASTVSFLTLPSSPDDGITPTEAFYKDLNSASDPNPNYPDTPIINAWSINGAYPPTPTPLPPLFSNATSWTEIELSVQDPLGSGTAGPYKLGQMCNGPLVSDTSGYANPPVQAVWFSMGGSMWVIIKES